jgi:ankyrin repeat protein
LCRSTESIKLLLAAGADVNNCDNRKRTPVHCAAEKGFLGSLKILGEFHPNYNALDENQCTPTMLSLTSGSFLTSKPLIQLSSQTMNVPSLPSGNTPLLEAISRSADMDVIKAILTYGGEVLVTNNDGQTALSISLAMGNAVLEFIFRELLVWCNGYRELRTLSMEERSFFIDVIFEVAEIFESSGDVTDRNSKIQDLTRAASKNHRFTSIEWLLSPSTGGLEFLDISSCLLMACNSTVENLPIIIALIKFRKKCAKRRPIMDYVDDEGRSILHICAMLGHANALTLLIDEIHAERSVCIFDVQDACGRSPFFLACQGGHIEVVKNLMQYSEVNLHLGDATGGRPIVAALINRHLDVVASILEVDPTLALDVSNNGTSILHIIAASDEYLPLAIRVMSIPNGRSLLGCARHTLTENGTVESSLPIDIAVKYDAIKMISHLRKMSMSLQEKKVLNLQTQIAAKIAESPALLNPDSTKNTKILFTRDSLHRKTQAVLLQNNFRCYFARLTLARHRAKFLLYCRRMLEAIIADDVQAVNYILRDWPALIRINLKDGLCALYLSCENAAAAVLDYLLANGIDANQVNQRSRNCLHYAVLSTVAPFVRKIAALQVSHSLQDHQGNTPLHLACINGDSAVADELLYLNSAPLSVENKENLNPDEVAIIHGHDALARKIVETKKHSSTQWDDFGSANIKFSSKVEADWISIRQKAIRRKAATQLQCIYRSYASRNILRLLTTKHHFRNQAAISIKLSIKSALARKRFFLNTQANILQRNWTVHKCRILCISLKQKKRIFHAQVCICYAVKMNAYRSKYRPHKAASNIQRVFLGHVSRKPYRDFVDKVHVRKRNFFSQRLQTAYRQHLARKTYKINKAFTLLRSIFSRFVAYRENGPRIQFLSLRRWGQHIHYCAKAFLQRRNYGVKIGNLTSLSYYLPQIILIQRAFASHKNVLIFRTAQENRHVDEFCCRRNTAASVISNNWRSFRSKRCLKFKKYNFVNSHVFLLQFYVLNKLDTEESPRMIRDASSKIARMFRIHLAKARLHHLKGEPMRLEMLHVKSACVSIISRRVRCFLAKSTLMNMLDKSKMKSINNAALCIFYSWRCRNARICKRNLAIASHLARVEWASKIVKQFVKNNSKNYKSVWQSNVKKRSIQCLSSYFFSLSARRSLHRNAMVIIIQRSWNCHRARMLVRNLLLRRLQGVSNSRLNRKGKTLGSTYNKTGSMHLNENKNALSRRKKSAPQVAIATKMESNTHQGESKSIADSDENIAICESEYDLEDKAYIFTRYLAQSKPSMKRSDSVPLPSLDPHWKEARSSSRPSSSASVRHYISYTLPSELGLGIEHRGNIRRLLEAKSYGENDFFPAPRVDYTFDKKTSKRPLSSSSSRGSSRPSSSISTTTFDIMASLSSKVVTAPTTSLQSGTARPVWLKMIILTGAAALHSKIESPFQAAAFENAVRKKNSPLALQIAESNLSTAKCSQSQEQYDSYILALISFAIIEAIKTVPNKSDSSCLPLLQMADETIR